MYGHCDKHNCEMTGFSTLFCPQCEKEKEAARLAAQATGGPLLGVGPGNDITYFAIVDFDFPEGHSDYFHTCLYESFESASRQSKLIKKPHRIIEVEIGQPVKDFWEPAPGLEPITFDLYRIHPDPCYQLNGTREARLVRVIMANTGATNILITAIQTNHPNKNNQTFSNSGLKPGRNSVIAGNPGRSRGNAGAIVDWDAPDDDTADFS